MKKLSISLFAVLAIVFAVTSAFTSKTSAPTFADEDFKIIAVNPNIVDDDESSQQVFMNNRVTSPINGVLYDSDIDPNIANQSQLSSWVDAQRYFYDSDNHKIVCQADANFSCVALFKRSSVSPFPYQLVALLEGDFSLQIV